MVKYSCCPSSSTHHTIISGHRTNMTMVPEIENYHHHQQQQLLLLLQGGGGYYGFLDHHTIMNRVDGDEYDQTGATTATTTNYCVGSDYNNNNNNNNLASSNPMAAADQDESSLNDAVSTSKEENNNNHDDDSWLTLGLGSHVATVRHDDRYSDDQPPERRRHRRELIELELLPARSGTSRAPPPVPQLPLGSILHMPEFGAPSTSRPVLHGFGNSSYCNNLFFQHQLQLQAAAGSSSTASFPHHHHHHQDHVGWSTFRPSAVKDKQRHTAAPSSSSLPFWPRPFDAAPGPPSSDFRVVDPPRRPHSGIWFFLQANQNQLKQPALPQIPKSYLRIKDGRMTVRLLIKYLANKLRVDSESEIEITCRGQEVEPYLTLQHVRDNIWSPSSSSSLLPHPSSTATDHLMVLHYARTTAPPTKY